MLHHITLVYTTITINIRRKLIKSRKLLNFWYKSPLICFVSKLFRAPTLDIFVIYHITLFPIVGHHHIPTHSLYIVSILPKFRQITPILHYIYRYISTYRPPTQQNPGLQHLISLLSII